MSFTTGIYLISESTLTPEDKILRAARKLGKLAIFQGVLNGTETRMSAENTLYPKAMKLHSDSPSPLFVE